MKTIIIRILFVCYLSILSFGLSAQSVRVTVREYQPATGSAIVEFKEGAFRTYHETRMINVPPHVRLSRRVRIALLKHHKQPIMRAKCVGQLP